VLLLVAFVFDFLVTLEESLLRIGTMERSFPRRKLNMADILGIFRFANHQQLDPGTNFFHLWLLFDGDGGSVLK
jgi:hypothetical protein